MKTVFLFSFLFVLATLHVPADVVFTGTSKYYGKITAITNATITIVKGCQNAATKISWDRRTAVNFNEQCYPPPGQTSASPRIIEPNCKTTLVFVLKLKNVRPLLFCRSISFNGESFKLTLYDGQEFLLQDFVQNRNIDVLSYSRICTDSIKTPMNIDMIPQLLPMTSDPNVFTTVEVMPLPIGGMETFNQAIRNTINYPADARQKNITGKVFVEFVVEKDGKLLPENVKVVRPLYKSLDDEAVRVLLLTSPWSPGLQRGEPVRTLMTVPITFNLAP